MLKGKLFPEGTTINLDDKDAQSLMSFLVILGEVEGSSSSNRNDINKKLKRNK